MAATGKQRRKRGAARDPLAHVLSGLARLAGEALAEEEFAKELKAAQQDDKVADSVENES